ncbi:hypothetical protein JHK85_009845 [Glycine max]|nr:hypothetical protein JHK85_009845 [Glycine max]KAG5065855.1 hypothetical protein JHK86_009586 [Glycine max]
MALKVAYSQLYRTRIVWCMPPAFAVDVINGTPVETLIQHYGKDWMPPFSNLNLNSLLALMEWIVGILWKPEESQIVDPARRKGRQNEGGNDRAVRDTQPVQGRVD